MIKNLSQLKKVLIEGAEFTIVEHPHSYLVGEKRKVNYTDTTGFYSIHSDNPNSKLSMVNRGRGAFLGWSKAPFWDFREDGTCALYSSDKNRNAKYLIVAVRLLGVG